MRTRTLAPSPSTTARRAVLADDQSGAGDDSVDLQVVSTAEGGQVGAELGEVGAGQVVDGHGVGTAEGAEVDGLDVVEVHDDVGDVRVTAGRGRRGAERP